MAFPNIVDINPQSNTLVRVLFDDEVVADSAYYSASSYSMSGGLEVVGVLNTNQNTSLDVIIVTRGMIVGTTYTVTIDGLHARDGSEATGVSGDFIARSTKLDSILRSIPAHYDKRNVSNIHAILSAISSSDDLIGGSRSDSITFD